MFEPLFQIAIGKEAIGFLCCYHAWLLEVLRETLPEALSRDVEGALLANIQTAIAVLWFEYDDYPVAIAWITNGPHLFLLYVEPSYRRTGLGRSLLGAAEAWAKGEGIGELTLVVEPENAVALALYESVGFEAEVVQMRKSIG